jgi:hypothetical protein
MQRLHLRRIYRSYVYDVIAAQEAEVLGSLIRFHGD